MSRAEAIDTGCPGLAPLKVSVRRGSAPAASGNSRRMSSLGGTSPAIRCPFARIANDSAAQAGSAEAARSARIPRRWMGLGMATHPTGRLRLRFPGSADDVPHLLGRAHLEEAHAPAVELLVDLDRPLGHRLVRLLRAAHEQEVA